MCRYQSASASPHRDSTNDVGLHRFRLESLAPHPVHLSQGLPSTPSDKLSFSVSRTVGDAPDGAGHLGGYFGRRQSACYDSGTLAGLNRAGARDRRRNSLAREDSDPAALAGREHLQVALSVVDDKDPLLAFGEDGLLLAPGLPLPARPTWLLFPGESNELTIVGEASPFVGEPTPARLGWVVLAAA